MTFGLGMKYHIVIESTPEYALFEPDIPTEYDLLCVDARETYVVLEQQLGTCTEVLEFFLAPDGTWWDENCDYKLVAVRVLEARHA
jgi:hypothetical protein